LDLLTIGKLYAFDQDEDARLESIKISHKGFHFIKSNFRNLKMMLRSMGVEKVDGILADLGVSSHQFDTPERGFSIRFDADLDMRMDQSMGKTAKEIINQYPEHELHKIFGMFGEIKNAKTLAKTIVSKRANAKIETTDQLNEILEKLAPKKEENKYKAQAYQALRIETNDEMSALKEALEQCPQVLANDGRLVVMSYHSLEDRLVKNFIANGQFYGEAEKDIFGNTNKPLIPVSRKAIEPTEEEKSNNNRARSAKLRIAVKNPEYHGN
ncbi:MAG: 16S rRNA (cytosine(1402)-N(4))-methyltransferase RsmH, partial [Cytophagales bacterium]